MRVVASFLPTAGRGSCYDCCVRVVWQATRLVNDDDDDGRVASSAIACVLLLQWSAYANDDDA